jgi:hypothetical protein
VNTAHHSEVILLRVQEKRRNDGFQHSGKENQQMMMISMTQTKVLSLGVILVLLGCRGRALLLETKPFLSRRQQAAPHDPGLAHSTHSELTLGYLFGGSSS